MVDSPVKSSGPGVFFVGRFSIESYIPLIGLFEFYTSCCVCFGKLYFSNSVSTLSKFQMHWHQVRHSVFSYKRFDQ